MTKNKKIIQLSLISIGFFLILATYFIYPKIVENKFLKEKAVEDRFITTGIEDSISSNTFENVEYKGSYNIDKPFTIKSEKAYILKKEPDIIHMTSVEAILYMDDGSFITITSDNGRYNKVSYDCFFENNVKAVDDKTTVLAENIDLLATKDSAAVYNNVFLTNNEGSLKADKIFYNFETKHYKISMFNDEKVKIKFIK